MAPTPEGWLYKDPESLDAEPKGYFSSEQMLVEAAEGRLNEQCTVWHAKHTRGDWKPSASFKTFADRFQEGLQFQFDSAANAAIASRKEQEARAARLEADRQAALKHLVDVALEKTPAAQVVTVEEKLPPEFKALADRLTSLTCWEEKAHQERMNQLQATHNNGAFFCFFAFILFGSGAAAVRSESPAFAWLGCGAFIFLVLSILKFMRSLTL